METYRLQYVCNYRACAMCAGAIINSRIERLVIGARDPKMGCCGSVVNLVDNPNFNHRVEVKIGVLEDECSSIITKFFKQIRKKQIISLSISNFQPLIRRDVRVGLWWWSRKPLYRLSCTEVRIPLSPPKTQIWYMPDFFII